MSFILIIDAREKALIDLLTISYPDVKFETKNLDIGDIHVYHNGVLVIIIERKTIADLIASIKDGRYKEQKLRLLAQPKSTKIIYLIEGKIVDDCGESSQSSVSTSTIWSIFVKLLLRDSFNVFRTKSLKETGKFVSKIMEKGEECFKDGAQYTSASIQQDYKDCLKTKKKENITPAICFVRQLCQIQGCSTTIAEQIAVKYPNMVTLVNALSVAENKQT